MLYLNLETITTLYKERNLTDDDDDELPAYITHVGDERVIIVIVTEYFHQTFFVITLVYYFE